MAFLKTKSEDLTVALVGVFTPQRWSYFRSNWQSNRENGQIVKRESPFGLQHYRYTRWNPLIRALDAGNEFVATQLSGWVMMSSIAYGRAYGAFKREAEMPSAEVLLNVVEGRKALEMMAARVFQVRNLLTNLRKGRLGDAWNFMTLNPNASLRDLARKPVGYFKFKHLKEREQMMLDREKWRRLVRDVGNLLLEIRYGWSPLMQDIKGAADTLSKPIPDKPIKAVKTARYTNVAGGVGGDPVHYSERVTIVGKIRISNPNLDLANRLGLLNPLGVLWEAIPFSFLFDWFLSVGNFLQGLTDFAGIEMIDSSVTGVVRGVAPKRRANVARKSDGSDVYLDYNAYSFVGVKRVRTVGSTLPRPPLMLGNGLSPGRAINAVALLLQQIKPSSARASHG